MSRYWSKLRYLKGRWVTLNANFRGKGASPTNEFWHQKTRVPELSYDEKIAENFNRLSRAHQRHRRQTDRRQTELRRQVVNVNASSRPLKMDVHEPVSCARNRLVFSRVTLALYTCMRSYSLNIHCSIAFWDVFTLRVLLVIAYIKCRFFSDQQIVQ